MSDSKKTVVGCCLASAMLACFGFGVFSIWSHWKNSPSIGAAVVSLVWPIGIGLVTALMSWIGAEKGDDRVSNALISVFLFGPCLYGCGLALIWVLQRGAAFVSHHVPEAPARVIGTVVLLVLGVILFLFRHHARASYGLTEVAFALHIGWKQLPQTTLHDWDLSQSLSLAPVLLSGCIYLVVRGLDNIQQGRNKDKLLTVLFSGLQRSR